LAGREDGPDVWLMFTSPLHPATAYAFDVSAATLAPFEPAKPPLVIDRFETRQLFATSKDGTRIPFFLTASRPFRRDGRAPLMLYGYGGFSVNALPAYRPDVPAWLEMGGVWVSANIRGGAENGGGGYRS